MIKVGDSAEIVVITDNSRYSTLYKKGDYGLICQTFDDGDISAFVGISTNDGNGKLGWYIPHGSYKKVGRVKITKVK